LAKVHGNMGDDRNLYRKTKMVDTCVNYLAQLERDRKIHEAGELSRESNCGRKI